MVTGAAPLSAYYWLEGGAGGHSRRLGEIFCVSFFRESNPAEVLHRFGKGQTAGREMSFEELGKVVGDFAMNTQGGSGGGYVGVCRVGGWSVAVELLGWYAVLHEYFSTLSRGCEMVAVSRHDYAEDGFVYAADGEAITGFTPHSPGRRWGDDPDRLNQAMRNVGMRTQSLDDLDDAALQDFWDHHYEHRIARAFALAEQITGIAFTPTLLDGTFLVGAIDQRT